MLLSGRLLGNYQVAQAQSKEVEVKTTLEKINKCLDELNKSTQQCHLEQRLYSLERETSEVIRVLSIEIDLLKETINKSSYLTPTKGEF